nr:immunoglobulin heavy chain junction region [Mus musculus]
SITVQERITTVVATL